MLSKAIDVTVTLLVLLVVTYYWHLSKTFAFVAVGVLYVFLAWRIIKKN